MITISQSKTGSRGFALVVTLSLMILLTVIAVGLLSLSSISLRSTGSGTAQATARANARMAMMLAIGELQKSAGRDQSVTGPATLGQTGPVANPAWTGAWKSDDKNSTPVWLVSGDKPDPAGVLTATNSVILSKKAATAELGSAAANDLRAAWVKLDAKNKGRYAYWIGDEGIKAKVDITKPTNTPSLEREQYARSSSPQETGLTQVNKDVFAGFEPGGKVNKQGLATMATVALAATEAGGVTRSELPRHYLHDLTSGGYGLPVNVKDGGMKADLSLVFDRSQQSKSYVANFLGATPSAGTVDNAKITKFSVTNASKFYLSDEIRNNSGGGTGPNWGNLWNYARQWENVTGNQSPVIGSFPEPQSENKQTGWKPYTNYGNGAYTHSDTQHINSGLSPVVSLVQIGIYLAAGPPQQVPIGGNKTETRYQAELRIKPVIGLWNPYNVKISSSSYTFDCALLPYLRLAYAKPNANGTFPYNQGNTAEIWLRDEWKKQAGGGAGYEASSNSYMQLRVPAVDFEPGEFRLFSAKDNPDIADINDLEPTLNVAGSFKVKIKRSADGLSGLAVDKKGQPLTIAEGNYGWFGDIYLQDTHFPATQAHIGTGADPNATTSWFNLKAGGSDYRLQRFGNLWNGGKDSTVAPPTFPLVPEPIVTKRDELNVNNNSTRKVTDIKRLFDFPAHAGTWRFSLRTSTDLANDPTQGLRGWIDSNPRVIASDVRFDGSHATPTKRDGWNTVSYLMGGSHGMTDKSVGDGLLIAGGTPGNRGLVAEGEIGKIFPEGPAAAGRWRMYGGGSNKVGKGFTHVIAYDVPRSPLTSIGQFQHAELSRYNYEPGFVVGNSYANPRIPLDKTVNPDFNPDSPGGKLEIVDISYEVNKRIWDSVFFSTLAPDYVFTSASTYAKAINYKALVARTLALPNPRMLFTPQPGDKSLETIISTAGDRAPQAMASRILIDGGFNVNSTSKTAWKAILSSLGGSSLPVITTSSTGTTTSWENPAGIRFNRFGAPILKTPYNKGAGLTPSFWQSWRNLSEAELDELAAAIVTEVQTRGPFRSFADFVNRDPEGSIDEQRKGPLQASLDKTINTVAAIPKNMGNIASRPVGSGFSEAISGENQTAGHAGYLLQGDILQSLAPILQVRSDYFRIRTCGQAFAADGTTVVATAYCEAFVQRAPDYTDSADKPEVAAADITSTINRAFGRRIQLVSFRWLSPAEI